MYPEGFSCQYIFMGGEILMLKKRKIPLFTLIYTIVGYISFFKCQVKFIFK